MIGALPHAGRPRCAGVAQIDECRQFCNNAIWMERGEVRASGEVNEILDAYLAEVE